ARSRLIPWERPPCRLDGGRFRQPLQEGDRPGCPQAADRPSRRGPPAGGPRVRQRGEEVIERPVGPCLGCTISAREPPLRSPRLPITRASHLGWDVSGSVSGRRKNRPPVAEVSAEVSLLTQRSRGARFLQRCPLLRRLPGTEIGLVRFRD